MMQIDKKIIVLKLDKDWTTFTGFYCKKRELRYDNSIHVEREIENDGLRARSPTSTTQITPTMMMMMMIMMSGKRKMYTSVC